MEYIYDEDSANTAYAERQQEEKDYRSKMHTISDVLHQLHPNCNVEIRMKLALEGLSEEDLERVW